MFVKVCGITRLEDAEAAVAFGAGALGFVFWPKSPRFIDPYRARTIVASLPPLVATVGVFVNQPAEYVNGVASLVGLSAVQLHGDETPAFAGLMRRPVIKAVAIDGAGADLGRPGVEGWSERVTILLDAHDPGQRGGTGRTIDWTTAAAIARGRRVVLAGGLTPENIAEAIRSVKPFGVDVSSGVEAKPGVKDHGRLRALFDALQS
jgi:phosphoribosylanthranilate isomerase